MITAPRKKRSDSESGVRLLVVYYYYYYSQSAIWQLARNLMGSYGTTLAPRVRRVSTVRRKSPS